jgi:hypothetical protein
VAGAYTRTDRAMKLLDWQPHYGIAEGIRHSLRWEAIRDGSLHLAEVVQASGPSGALCWRPLPARRMLARSWRDRRNLPWPLVGDDAAVAHR